MCGIAGSFGMGPGGAAAREGEVRAMMAAMARRGPDGEGFWQSADGTTRFGHRRLAIIDLSENGLQPMHSASGRTVITFNGEIYNYQELREELVAAGTAFHSHSDTEVLLALYERHGVGMLDKLRGMFAFAIYDHAERLVLVARDPYGIKPLYYSTRDGVTRFCSQVRPLRGALGACTASQAGMAGFLLFGSVPEPFTLFEEIRSLQAGHYLLLRDGQVPVDREYASVAEEFTAAGRGAGVLVQGRNDYYRELFRRSVEYHMVADVDVHVYLSAGKDSTAVAALASEGRGNVKSVTLGFPEFAGTPQDEMPVAREVAQQLGLDHHEVLLPLAEREGLVDTFLAAMDQPTIDGLNTFFVSRALAELGGKIALSGLGGDELLMGYSTFTTLPKLVRYCGLGPVRALLSGDGVRRMLSRVAKGKAQGLFALGGTMAGGYLLKRGVYMPWELGKLMGVEEAAAGLAGLGWTAMLERAIAGVTDPRLQVGALETQCYMRNQLLRDADWAGMRWSVEIRTPLVDYQLLRGAVAGRRQGLGWPGKGALLGATEKALPQSVQMKAKTGFSIPEFDPAARAKGKQTGYREWTLRVMREYLGAEGATAPAFERACGF